MRLEALDARDFSPEPKEAPYIKAAVFEGPYGSLWDLVRFADT